MGKITVKYVITKRKNGKKFLYWQPKARYKVRGVWKDCPFNPVALTEETLVVEAKKLNEALMVWRNGEDALKVIRHGTLDWLMAEYRKDVLFTGLATGTQALYRNEMKTLSQRYGDFPVARITRELARNLYISLDPSTRKASQTMQVGRVIFWFGTEYRHLKFNPFEKQKIKKHPARKTIISKEDIETAKVKAKELGLESIATAIQIGSDGGQRPGDIRMLPRTNYDGKWLSVRQSKTKALVDIPIYKLPVLKAMLDNLTHASVLILHEERTGKPYSKDMLCSRVREVFRAAGLGDDIQFRDLRRTAVVRLAEAGCEIPEICAITGHSLKEVTEILEVYLPRTRKMAENAIDKVQKMERKDG